LIWIYFREQIRCLKSLESFLVGFVTVVVVTVVAVAVVAAEIVEDEEVVDAGGVGMVTKKRTGFPSPNSAAW